VDVEPVETGAVGGDVLMHQPDLAEEGVGQTGEADGQGGLVHHPRRQQHKGPHWKRPSVVRAVENGPRLIAAEGGAD